MTSVEGPSVLDAYPPATDADRERLLEFARKAPITFGSWRDLKGLYKRVEGDAGAEPPLLGALLGRLDAAPMAPPNAGPVTADLGSVRNVAGVAVRGGRAYVLGGRYGYAEQLDAFDLQVPDPLKPRRLSSTKIDRGQTIGLCGPFLCVFTTDYNTISLNVYDLAEDPDKPAQRGKIDLGGNAVSAGFAHPYVFVGTPGAAGRRNAPGGLRIVRISDTGVPTTVGKLDVPNALAVAASEDGRLALLAVQGTGFSWSRRPTPGVVRVIDTSDPTRPQVISTIEVTNATGVWISGRHAFIAAGAGRSGGDAGLHVVDLSDPKRPRKVAFVGTEWYPPSGIVVRGQHLYAASGYGGTRILDISDPAAPKQIAVESGLEPFVTEDGVLAYASGGYSGLSVWNISTPATPFRVGAPPSADTMGYMKRRARRLLRGLAKTDPERYVEVACRMLLESGQHLTGKRAERAVDPDRHWASMDVLFGGSGRFTQTRHGRGRYVERNKEERPRFRLRTREERAPEAWDRRPDLASALLTTASLPWQTYEAALKMLRAAKAPLPDIPEGALPGFLGSESPLLIRAATRRVADRLGAGRAVAPNLAADAYLLAGAARRRVIEAGIARQVGARGEWAQKFATELVTRVRETSGGGAALTRRQAGGLALLARTTPDVVPVDKLLPLLGRALAARHPDLTPWLHAVLGRLSSTDVITPTSSVVSAVALLESLPEDVREPALAAIGGGMAGKRLDLRTAQNGVQAISPWVRAATWRLLAASATDETTLGTLWRTLLDSPQQTPALETAMASPDALVALSRSGIRSDEMAARLNDRPFLIGLLSPQTFGTITQSVSASVTLRLIAAAPDDLWERLRPAWLRNLREGIGVDDLWANAEAALADDVDDRLVRRVLQDEEVARTLLEVENAEQVLSIREDTFGPLLGRYVERHAERFGRDSALLLDAATHLLPEVRDWALARVGSVGMGLPFALRLLESEVPPSVRVGRTFFEGVPPGGDREFDYALALCDSPQKSVRAIGREFVQARRETLPREDVLRALFENPDPETQAFVASLLGETPQRPAETAAFDGEVLRARNRARGAKERVKARQAAEPEPTVDVETLLALARSAATPRDAEWALAQLARLALAGQQIEGFSLDGVAGG